MYTIEDIDDYLYENHEPENFHARVLDLILSKIWLEFTDVKIDEDETDSDVIMNAYVESKSDYCHHLAIKEIYKDILKHFDMTKTEFNESFDTQIENHVENFFTLC